VNGQLQVALLQSVSDDSASTGTVTMSIGTRLDDNTWHSLRVLYRTGFVLTAVYNYSMQLFYCTVNLIKNKWKYECTIDQEVLIIASGQPASGCSGRLKTLHSPGGSTFLSEMTPWPLSWKYDVILKSYFVNRCVFTWRTILPNFISIRLESTAPQGHPNKKNKNNKMSSDIWSLPDL